MSNYWWLRKKWFIFGLLDFQTKLKVKFSPIFWCSNSPSYAENYRNVYPWLKWPCFVNCVYAAKKFFSFYGKSFPNTHKPSLLNYFFNSLLLFIFIDHRLDTQINACNPKHQSQLHFLTCILMPQFGAPLEWYFVTKITI